MGNHETDRDRCGRCRLPCRTSSGNELPPPGFNSGEQVWNEMAASCRAIGKRLDRNDAGDFACINPTPTVSVSVSVSVSTNVRVNAPTPAAPPNVQPRSKKTRAPRRLTTRPA